MEELEADGVVLKKCKTMPVYQLGHKGEMAYLEFLAGDNETDTLIIPTFGDPTNQFIGVHAQREVCYLLHKFSSAPNPDVTEIPPTFTTPLGNGYRFYSSLLRVQQDIANPQFCPNLCSVPSGNIICDITIIYANCAVQRRITRA
jgi:hypothetical protein